MDFTATGRYEGSVALSVQPALWRTFQAPEWEDETDDKSGSQLRVPHMTPCRDFHRGLCRFGLACKFAHIEQGKNCPYWSMLGYCNNLPNCPNFHLPANCKRQNVKAFSFVPIIETIWKVNLYSHRTQHVCRQLAKLWHRWVMSSSHHRLDREGLVWPCSPTPVTCLSSCDEVAILLLT